MDQARLSALLKRFPCKELENGNIRTCPARLSFPALFEKRGIEGSEPKYSAVLLFPKGADLTVLHEAAKHTAIEAFGAKAGSMGLHMPFRDQGIKALAGYEAGAYFITASTKQRPGVVGADLSPITDPEDAPAGYWVIATVRPFSYDAKMKKGVSYGLQNIQVIAADEPFAGGSRPTDDFEPLDASMTGEDAFAAAGQGGGAFGFE